MVEYAPLSKIPNPSGGWPSSHFKTLVIISPLISTVTHARELGGRKLTGNDLACMDDKDEE